MNAVVSSRWFLKVDPAFVDAFVLAEHRLQNETHFIAVGFEMSTAVEHHLVVRPVLGVFHVFAPGVHADPDDIEEKFKEMNMERGENRIIVLSLHPLLIFDSVCRHSPPLPKKRKKFFKRIIIIWRIGCELPPSVFHFLLRSTARMERDPISIHPFYVYID